MADAAMVAGILIDRVSVDAFRIPAPAPESDGTLEWDATTLVLVQVTAGGREGLGYTYADRPVAVLIADKLGPLLQGRDAMEVPACWRAMVDACRNLGRPGMVSMAVAACDVALHDLKAKLLDLPLAHLLGRCRDRVPVYGSGGFTSLSDAELAGQLGAWAADGLPAVKMKVGRQPDRDPPRVALARDAIGPATGLLVDANGAYARKQALQMAERFAGSDVIWFEEPVSSEDLAGLRLLRDRMPGGMEVSAGEYGYDSRYFRRMAAAGAVDVLQADASRCAGITGFLLADALAHAYELPLSSHTAPALHLPCCLAAQQVRHMEWFADHVRIERTLFDGATQPRGGLLEPDLSRPGLGLSFRHADARRYRI